MAEDYYKTLGISRDASAAEIQKAYRELARKYHPDLNPDDKSAKEKFQKVQTAFDVLNDPGKRELYDRYGSSFESMGAAQGDPRARHARPGPVPGGAEDFDFSQFINERFGGDPGGGGFADLFTQFRRGASEGRGAKGRGPARRGEDLQFEVQVPFNIAVCGGKVDLNLTRPSGKTETLSVKIPPGVDDGQTIRLRGQGEPGPRGGTAGDLLLSVHIALHPHFQRRGNHLDVKVPVTLAEAAVGAKIDVPTPRGTVSVRVPPGTSSGKKLKIKGYGVARKGKEPGDLFAEIQIQLPPTLDEAALDMIKQLDQRMPQNPRHDLIW